MVTGRLIRTLLVGNILTEKVGRSRSYCCCFAPFPSCHEITLLCVSKEFRLFKFDLFLFLFFNCICFVLFIIWLVHGLFSLVRIILFIGLLALKTQTVLWWRGFSSYVGSAWMALSRSFIDYCIWGWDNLPRTVLMYYANFLSSPEGYFHTVICNAPEFKNTTVNSDLHFISWDNPPKQHPHYLNVKDMARIIESNAPFARKFPQDDPVLDRIDSELLSRGPGMTVPGGWCVGPRENGTDPCSVSGNTTVLRPSPGVKRLEKLMSSLLSTENYRPKQCKWGSFSTGVILITVIFDCRRKLECK